MSIMANVDSKGVEALKALSAKASHVTWLHDLILWKMAFAIYETFPY